MPIKIILSVIIIFPLFLIFILWAGLDFFNKTCYYDKSHYPIIENILVKHDISYTIGETPKDELEMLEKSQQVTDISKYRTSLCIYSRNINPQIDKEIYEY